MKRNQPERLIQNAIIDYLLLKGHFVWRTVNRGWQLPNGQWKKSAVEGLPDICGVERNTGRFIGLEVKSKGNHATEAQKTFIARITANGGLGAIVYDVEMVQKLGL